jgi:hypothetical protein
MCLKSVVYEKWFAGRKRPSCIQWGLKCRSRLPSFFHHSFWDLWQVEFQLTRGSQCKPPFERFSRWGTQYLFHSKLKINAYSARHSQLTSFPIMLRYFSTTNGSMFLNWCHKAVYRVPLTPIKDFEYLISLRRISFLIMSIEKGPNQIDSLCK